MHQIRGRNPELNIGWKLPGRYIGREKRLDAALLNLSPSNPPIYPGAAVLEPLESRGSHWDLMKFARLLLISRLTSFAK